jgi:hypothetical protein
LLVQSGLPISAQAAVAYGILAIQRSDNKIALMAVPQEDQMETALSHARDLSTMPINWKRISGWLAGTGQRHTVVVADRGRLVSIAACFILTAAFVIVADRGRLIYRLSLLCRLEISERAVVVADRGRLPNR